MTELTMTPGLGGGREQPSQRGLLACLVVGAVFVSLALAAPSMLITAYYVTAQDLPMIVLAALVCSVAWRVSQSGRAIPSLSPSMPTVPWRAALGFALVAFAGHFVLLDGHAFSADERRVLMDAAIFSSGQLTAPLPEAWQGDPEVILPFLVRLSEDGTRWASCYLPLNAMLHLAAARLGSAGLAAPLLSAAAVAATWACARRLWPSETVRGGVAVVFLLTSAQVLVTAMTPFAMTAHLAFNMTWLWLFLRGGRLGHAGAMGVGFLAMGLHQYVFHPFFAGPFLATLLWHRRFGLAAVYAAAYAFGLAFWIAFPGLVMIESDITSNGSFAEHLRGLLSQASFASVTLMAANLVRLVAWQNLVWLPFLAVGTIAAVKGRRPIEIALIGAVVAMPLLAFVVLPNQGFGWGYRYMHGTLGAAALLGGLGFTTLTERAFPAGRVLAIGTAATLLLAMPFLALTTSRMILTTAKMERDVAALGPGFVVINNIGSALTSDLVANGPETAADQIRLRLDQLSDTHPCAKSSVAGPQQIVETDLDLDGPIAWRCPDAIVARKHGARQTQDQSL